MAEAAQQSSHGLRPSLPAALSLRALSQILNSFPGHPEVQWCSCRDCLVGRITGGSFLGVVAEWGEASALWVSDPSDPQEAACCKGFDGRIPGVYLILGPPLTRCVICQVTSPVRALASSLVNGRVRLDDLKVSFCTDTLQGSCHPKAWTVRTLQGCLPGLGCEGFLWVSVPVLCV